VLVAQSAQLRGVAPNQKRMRRFKPSADSGSLPNQNSRTLRASSMSTRAGSVGLEQPFQLLRGLGRGGEELGLIVLDLVLRGQRRLIVLAEPAHRLAGLRRRFPSASRTEAAISRLEP